MEAPIDFVLKHRLKSFASIRSKFFRMRIFLFFLRFDFCGINAMYNIAYEVRKIFIRVFFGEEVEIEGGKFNLI